MSLIANWSYPTAIKFGAGRISELPEACAELNISKPLFVTDKGLVNLDITQHSLATLKASNIDYDVFHDVDTNPTNLNVEAGLTTLKAGRFDGIIAFGGGSALDLGKAIAFMAGQTRPLWDFEDIGDWWTRADADVILPIIAIPTTAGTGSEVGRASVITNANTKEKKIIFHPKMLPGIAICDPELTISMPKFITAGTGLDALAHCIEAYSSPHYHPMSQGIALEGMKLVKDNLVKAYHDGTDMEARGNMMSAAMMGATAFQKGLGAIHALSHPIGAIYNTHHGTTNAVCTPHVLTFNKSVIKSKFEKASAYLDITGGFDGFCSFVKDLNQELNIPKSLTELGVLDPDIDRIVSDAIKDPSASGNPIKLTTENTRALLCECL